LNGEIKTEDWGTLESPNFFVEIDGLRIPGSQNLFNDCSKGGMV